MHVFLTAQLSGNEGEDLDYEQIEELLHSERRDPLTRAKKAIYRLVKRVGFFGILLCASVSHQELMLLCELVSSFFSLSDSQSSV